jgi:nitrite reductase/ring-hydroxylating ferredoxin subunit
MGTRVTVGALTDFPQGRGVAVKAGGRALAIFHMGDRILAVDDSCPHQRFPLWDGAVTGMVVTCRTHGSRFNLESGAVRRGPARRGIRSYPVHITDDTVEVELD